MKLILKWAARNQTPLLCQAVSNARAAALRSIEADLADDHPPELKKRHQELLALDIANTRIGLATPHPDDLWRLARIVQ